MSREVIVRNYCSDDLKDIKEILFEYPSPTGRVWSDNVVEEMIFDAIKGQRDGVFVAEMGEKVVGLAIAIYRCWFGVA